MGISMDGTKLLNVQYSDNSPLFFTFSILLAIYTRRKLSIIMQFTLLSWVKNTNSFHRGPRLAFCCCGVLAAWSFFS